MQSRKRRNLHSRASAGGHAAMAEREFSGCHALLGLLVATYGIRSTVRRPTVKVVVSLADSALSPDTLYGESCYY